MFTTQNQSQDLSTRPIHSLSKLAEHGTKPSNLTPAILGTISKLWNDLKAELHHSDIKTKDILLDTHSVDVFTQSSDWTHTNMKTDEVKANTAIVLGEGGLANLNTGNIIFDGFVSVASYGTNYSKLNSVKDKAQVCESIGAVINRNNIPFVRQETGNLYNVVPVEKGPGEFKLTEPLSKVALKLHQTAQVQVLAHKRGNSLNVQLGKRDPSGLSLDGREQMITQNDGDSKIPAESGPDDIFADAEGDVITWGINSSNERPGKKPRPAGPFVNETPVAQVKKDPPVSNRS